MDGKEEIDYAYDHAQHDETTGFRAVLQVEESDVHLEVQERKRGPAAAESKTHSCGQYCCADDAVEVREGKAQHKLFFLCLSARSRFSVRFFHIKRAASIRKRRFHQSPCSTTSSAQKRDSQNFLAQPRFQQLIRVRDGPRQNKAVAKEKRVKDALSGSGQEIMPETHPGDASSVSFFTTFSRKAAAAALSPCCRETRQAAGQARSGSTRAEEAPAVPYAHIAS